MGLNGCCLPGSSLTEKDVKKMMNKGLFSSTGDETYILKIFRVMLAGLKTRCTVREISSKDKVASKVNSYK